jgi:hypothetical protein
MFPIIKPLYLLVMLFFSILCSDGKAILPALPAPSADIFS